MGNSIIVWDTNEVIHKCPYEIITDHLGFERFGNAMVFNRSEQEEYGLVFENRFGNNPPLQTKF